MDLQYRQTRYGRASPPGLLEDFLVLSVRATRSSVIRFSLNWIRIGGHAGSQSGLDHVDVSFSGSEYVLLKKSKHASSVKVGSVISDGSVILDRMKRVGFRSKALALLPSNLHLSLDEATLFR